MKRIAVRRSTAAEADLEEALAVIAGADPAEIVAAKLRHGSSMLSFIRWDDQLGPGSKASFIKEVRLTRSKS